MQPRDSAGYRAAAALFAKHNPNDVLGGPCNFFEGLEGPAMRFVPLLSVTKKFAATAIEHAEMTPQPSTTTTPSTAEDAQERHLAGHGGRGWTDGTHDRKRQRSP